jgi:hypothetical protein
VADFAALYGHTGLKRPDCLQYIFDSKWTTRLARSDIEHLIDHLQADSTRESFVTTTKQKHGSVVKLEERGAGFDLRPSPHALQLKDLIYKVSCSKLALANDWSTENPLRFSEAVKRKDSRDMPDVSNALPEHPNESLPGESLLEVTMRCEKSILLYNQPRTNWDHKKQEMSPGDSIPGIEILEHVNSQCSKHKKITRGLTFIDKIPKTPVSISHYLVMLRCIKS